MAQVVNNFVRTTLRLPVTPSDVTLSLAVGGGAFFDMAPGDYEYIVVNDATTVEVMKYVSTGPVVGDIIGVLRGQDNTTAKAFPAGSCVSVGWNVAQITEFIQAMIDAIPPTPPPVLPPPGVLTIRSRGFVTDAGSQYFSGAYPLGALGLPDLINYDPGASGAITYDVGTGEVVFPFDCIMSMTATIHGTFWEPDLPNPFAASLSFTHTNGTDLIGNTSSLPVTGGTGNPNEGVVSAETGPIQVSAGDKWDANLNIYAFNGTYMSIVLKQAMVTAMVYVLT